MHDHSLKTGISSSVKDNRISFLLDIFSCYTLKKSPQQQRIFVFFGFNVSLPYCPNLFPSILDFHHLYIKSMIYARSSI
jgi:hypothetical protein